MDDVRQAAIDSTKVGSTWLFAGMTASDLAAYLAALYSALLIAEWIWKKAGRPLAVRLGWIKTAADEEAT